MLRIAEQYPGKIGRTKTLSSLLKNPFSRHFDGSKRMPDHRFYWPFAKSEILGEPEKMAGSPFSTSC
jgi:hypothetical protein